MNTDYLRLYSFYLTGVPRCWHHDTISLWDTHDLSFQTPAKVWNQVHVGRLLEFLHPGLSTVISGWVPSCDSVYSWWLYSAAPLRYLASSIMTPYPTQSHNPDHEPTSPCAIVIMPSAWLGSDKYTFLSHWFPSTRVRTHEFKIDRSPKMGDGRSTHSVIPSGRNVVASYFY